MSLAVNSVALPTQADVAIVGAGAMGLFTALSLTTAGRKVIVIDKERPWREASGVNAGSLGIQNKRQALVPFA
ncbi:MAG TPA: FAD-dependent oxidoreductase, partial [Nitrospirota bacterium]|nr:FAD-dependent oxidoreductase [Nitrospirota bacterium]